MASGRRETFGVGPPARPGDYSGISAPTTIPSGDLAGILMAACKELARENAAVKAEHAAAKQRRAEMEARLAKLELPLVAVR